MEIIKKFKSYMSLALTVLGTLFFSAVLLIEELKYPNDDDVVPLVYAVLLIVACLIGAVGITASAFFRTQATTSRKEYIAEGVLAAIGIPLFLLFFFDDKYLMHSVIGFDLAVIGGIAMISTAFGLSKPDIPNEKAELMAAFPYYLQREADELIQKLKEFPKASQRDNLFFQKYSLAGCDKNPLPLRSYATLNDGTLVSVPHRLNIGYDEELFMRADISGTMYRALLTRSYDGYIRQRSLEALVKENYQLFVMPYILEAGSDYVKEIPEALYLALKDKDNTALQIYCKANLESLVRCYQKMISYHNEYYKDKEPNYKNYVGYKLFTECFGFKKCYTHINFKLENEKWNLMWKMYSDGTLPKHIHALCEYEGAVNGEGHLCYFSNNEDKMPEYIKSLKFMLSAEMYEHLSEAYKSVGSEAETALCDKADEHFFSHEYEINFKLWKFAHELCL